MSVTLEKLAQDIQVLKRLNGIEKDWLTSGQAAKQGIWAISAIQNEIAIAEIKRRRGEPFDLKYGEHYVSVTRSHKVVNGEIVDTGSAKPTYKVNWPKFFEVVGRPEEERLF